MPEATETNKVHFDLTNVYIAKMLTDGDEPEWETPKRMYGAISMDLSAQGDTYKLRADGIDYYVSVSNNGYEGDINFAMIPDWYRQDILGETMSEKDKVLVENAQAEPAHYALIYEFLYDKKHRRHVLYNCVSTRPSIAGENKDNQKEPDTESLTVTASPLPSGNVKASTTEGTPDSVYQNWTTAVWKKDTTEMAKSAQGV